MTRKTALSCGSPHHQGDRLIRARSGAYERRIEYRRLTDQGRERTQLTFISCHGCMEAEVGGKWDTQQPSMFGGAR